jgi:hypothetical protein
MEATGGLLLVIFFVFWLFFGGILRNARPPKCPKLACLNENLKNEKNGLARVPSCIKGLNRAPKKEKKRKK